MELISKRGTILNLSLEQINKRLNFRANKETNKIDKELKFSLLIHKKREVQIINYRNREIRINQKIRSRFMDLVKKWIENRLFRIINRFRIQEKIKSILHFLIRHKSLLDSLISSKSILMNHQTRRTDFTWIKRTIWSLLMNRKVCPVQRQMKIREEC